MPSYYLNERFYIVYNINLIMFYDLLIFIFMSYIKPQLVDPLQIQNLGCISYYSCIKPQLRMCYHVPTLRCISYYSYIKPQLCRHHFQTFQSCISYYSYIKPQLNRFIEIYNIVVYRTIPTSNHNCWLELSPFLTLYIVLFLHQTTTWDMTKPPSMVLYIVLFLHQTTTRN